ncbi:cell division transport system permease protein [Clostridium tetanomorphum]|uniref:permease-like cell division protein FtsX n=1 Tax=Clostridium tetanomorphum TaxID=1553 RepID=UPI00044EF77C|nr:permease-like cell division protein FtsX [Clostridium tetanomorphum]KAJ53210.1 cell division protein FtsX [Clostridium tetanomorphum DSM 665]MBP1863612.1 cell division transport system permease protein [Clostridium tetanomorphum]NRS86188.1 cell division transport system permease protein [Clostridium tetanomorphum]SQC00807.1 cell division protein ftsX [Clostridium tetanomorphum]
MRISTFKYFVIDSLKSIKRNRTISLASAATVAATLFILGVFLLAALDVKQVIKDVESKVEVKIFLNNDITIGDEKALKSKLSGMSEISDLRYESKKEAMEKFKEDIGENNKALVEGLEKENPLPNAYIVKVKDPEMVSKVVDSVKGMKGIYAIQEGRKIVDKIITITKTIKWIGMALFAILIGVSLFLIGNTIKITVYSRRKEIGIMKYIGATDWFIRWPFIIEGMIIGLVGSIVGCILLYYGYSIVYTKASATLFLVKFIHPSYVLTTISWQFLLMGMLIGSIGSILSIRKFLAV